MLKKPRCVRLTRCALGWQPEALEAGRLVGLPQWSSIPSPNERLLTFLCVLPGLLPPSRLAYGGTRVLTASLIIFLLGRSIRPVMSSFADLRSLSPWAVPGTDTIMSLPRLVQAPAPATECLVRLQSSCNNQPRRWS